MTETKKPTRYANLRPSNAIVGGAVGAGAVAPLLVSVLQAANVTVTPELAAAVSPALGFLFAWLGRSGRQYRQ